MLVMKVLQGNQEVGVVKKENDYTYFIGCKEEILMPVLKVHEYYRKGIRMQVVE